MPACICRFICFSRPGDRPLDRIGLPRARSQDDGTIQKTRASPEYFGEISLLSEDNLVTATAVARTSCECYTLQVRPHRPAFIVLRFACFGQRSLECTSIAVRSHPRPLLQRDMFDELVKSNLKPATEEADEGSLENVLEKRSLFDEGIVSKVTVSAKMKSARTKVDAVKNLSGGTSFRNDSGSTTASALHGGESSRYVAIDESLPEEAALRDKLRELEFEFPPLK